MSKQKAKQSVSITEKNEKPKKFEKQTGKNLADDELERVSGGAGQPAAGTEPGRLRPDHIA
jgi:hypothetical protein